MRNSKIFMVFFVVLLFVYVSIKTPVISAVSDVAIDLSLEPPYATDLKIDISTNNPNYPGYGDGVSLETVYSFDDAITVKNNASKTGLDTVCVSLVSKSDKLSFYLKGGTVSRTVNITLHDNESRSVGIVINTSLSELGVEEITYSVFVYEGECK